MTIREIDELIEQGNSLKQIAQAYSEIANQKIKRIRIEVERNRLFFEEILSVYNLIKELAAKKNKTSLKPKKTISLVITSNYRFYGNINSDLIDFFVDQTQKIEADKILIGKAAVDFFRTSKVGNKYQEVIFKDDQPNAQELNSLVSLIKDYNQVLVFYSKFKTLLVQLPTVVDITASFQKKPQLNGSKKENFRFIFEPQLSKILEFFDSQILILLLEATFLESEVSRTASRFISMDQAETEANKFIKQYEMLKAYIKRSLENNTILENFASMAAVRKEQDGYSN